MYNLFTSVWKTQKPVFFLFNEKTMSLHFNLTYARKYREVYIFFHHENKKKKVMQAV